MSEPSDLLLTELCQLINQGELRSLEIVESCL
jgi:hypothetical protein